MSRVAAPSLIREEIAACRATAKRVREREQEAREKRFTRAWESARCAARLLREQYGATRIVVFGSLVREGCFTRRSDIDLAAWGIAAENTFKAVAAVLGIDREIQINLVDTGAARPSILAAIEREGIEL